jgi:hypothetical protein
VGIGTSRMKLSAGAAHKPRMSVQVKIDYRPVHNHPMTKDMPEVPPKARTY